MATTNTWLKEEYTNERTIEHYEKWLGYIQMLAVFCSPISGMIIDYSVQYFREKKVQSLTSALYNVQTLEPRLASLGFHSAVTSICGLLYSLLIFSGRPSLQVRIIYYSKLKYSSTFHLYFLSSIDV